MHGLKKWLVALAVVTSPIGPTLAAEPLTEERAVEMALQAHPGNVLEADKETENGQEVWQVEIEGDDGKTWEVYYTMDGKLLQEESEEAE